MSADEEKPLAANAASPDAAVDPRGASVGDVPGSPTRSVRVKKYGAGKAFAFMSGPTEYAALAEAALRGCFTCYSSVDSDRFRAKLEAAGVPGSAIEAFLRSLRIDDEAYLSEDWR